MVTFSHGAGLVIEVAGVWCPAGMLLWGAAWPGLRGPGVVGVEAPQYKEGV